KSYRRQYEISLDYSGPNPLHSFLPLFFTSLANTDEHMLHYYRWTSAPGVMKIMCIIIIIMCVALFVCVASTLAWDYDMEAMGMGGLGMGMGGGAYGGSGGYGGGGSYGGYYMDPLTGKGFIIGIAAITFIAVLVIFILVVSRQNTARSHKFYLASIIICAILALLMLIASVVYLVAVNPRAQSSGSMMYNMIWQMCSQYQSQSQATGIFINQYMYHYCVVEPQEAIAIVLGFLLAVALIILLVFSLKTRQEMRRYGRQRVLWEEPKLFNDTFSHGVEKWVSGPNICSCRQWSGIRRCLLVGVGGCRPGRKTGFESSFWVCLAPLKALELVNNVWS
uniref:Occludin b n=1 Tax=Astyanax mexicanus TaxID=7994 RepID=A0A8B9RGW2_ASTMX